jgi:S-adenosylmethionine hydrolase
MKTITFTTDFGDGSTYVAAMKGVVLSVNADARLFDLTHRLPPQDLVAAAYFLSDSLEWFPDGTIHVVVVDPGVGTDRALLCVEYGGQVVLVPDNGCWTPLFPPSYEPSVYRIEERRYWLPEVSPTFHGRDILAPVAAHLSLGTAPAELGPKVSQWIRLNLPEPVITSDSAHGQVVMVDRFGNLVTNIPGNDFSGLPVRVAGKIVDRWVKSYGHAEPGKLVALIGSNGRLEVAVVNGSAARQLGVGVGAVVNVERARLPRDPCFPLRRR